MPGQALPQRLLWRGDDLPTTAGRLALPVEVEKELDGVVAALERDPLPLLLLKPGDFALDAARAFMREVRRTIDEGPGFAIVDRLPVERWTVDAARAVWWLLASLVARPVAQKWDGTSIYDVTDLGRPPATACGPTSPTSSRTSIPTTATTMCRRTMSA